MKNAWKRHWYKRNENTLKRLYLYMSDSFKDGSSKLNNHSAITVGKLILALSDQFKVCFIPKLFSLRFCMSLLFRVTEVWMKKPTCTLYGVVWINNTDVHILVWIRPQYTRHTKMYTSDFSIPQWNEKKSTVVKVQTSNHFAFQIQWHYDEVKVIVWKYRNCHK